MAENSLLAMQVVVILQEEEYIHRFWEAPLVFACAFYHWIDKRGDVSRWNSDEWLRRRIKKLDKTVHGNNNKNLISSWIRSKCSSSPLDDDGALKKDSQHEEIPGH